MKRLFADTLYWVAIANRHDQWHKTVMNVAKEVQDVHLVTTEEVLAEFLAALSGAGPAMRTAAVKTIRLLLSKPTVTVLPQSHDTFLAGLDLYERRTDKGYSLTDCISMNACHHLGITEVLANGHHFAQEGFVLLIR